MKRLFAVIGIAVALTQASLTSAMASNWGAGTTDTAYRCLQAGNTSTYPEEWFSECTSNDDSWFVYIDNNVNSVLATAMANSVNYDYDLSYFSATLQNSLTSNTDARVLVADIPTRFDYAIYTTCASNATLFGSGYYKACRPHLLKWDPTDPPTKPNRSEHVLNNKAFFACHELGHATGLQHTDPLENNPLHTCMSYDGWAVLHAHDREHLRDCYPRASQATLTDTCKYDGIFEPCGDGSGTNVPCP